MNQNNENQLLTQQEIEEAVICTLLAQPETMLQVTGLLTPEMFSFAPAGFIYSALLARYDRGETSDYLTVEAEMKRMDPALFEKYNGIGILGDALHRIRHAAGLSAYIEEIKRAYLLRTLKGLFQSLTLQASQVETDPLELIGMAESKLHEIVRNIQSGSSAIPLATVAHEMIRTFEKQANTAGKQTTACIKSGFRELDMLTGGFKPGELYVLAGRPADGKTAVALEMAAYIAANGKRVNYFILEMEKEDLAGRRFQAEAGIESNLLRNGNFRITELEAMKTAATAWEGHAFHIDDNPDTTLENIRVQVLLMAKKEKYDLIVVDHLHLLTRQPRPGEIPNQVISETVRTLKKLARQAGCAILLLSQLNRESEKRTDKQYRPMLADLRDSGSIEQDADMAFFVYRPERHGILQDPISGKSTMDVVQLLVLKNRHGITGTINLRHDGNFCNFKDEKN